MPETSAGMAETPDEQAEEDGVASAFRTTVDEGVRRLERTPGALLATGLVGGIDVSVGVFGLLVVLHHTHSKVLASLAFSIGFIALTMANSELFTENFLVPIAALVARRQGYYSLGRLWGGTAITNLAGGWVIAALIISGFPELRPTAEELGAHFVEIGIGWRSLAVAMLGGAIITLMTWMIQGARSQGAKIIAAAVAGFLLAVGEINHCIVASLEMFAGLIAGASYGYLDWLTVFLWAAFGNMIGGIGLVTILRFAQIGGDALREEQRNQRRNQRAAGGP